MHSASGGKITQFSSQSRGMADENITLPDGINLLPIGITRYGETIPPTNYQIMVSNVLEMHFLLELIFEFRICEAVLVMHPLLVQ